MTRSKTSSSTQAASLTEDLEAFFSLNLDLLCIADLEGNFIRTNEAWSRILGYSTEELNQKKFLEFVHPQDMQATLAAMAELSKGDQVLEFTNRYRSKDGSYRFIEWRSHPKGERIYAAARDVTEKVMAERRLATEKQQTDMFFNQSLHGFFMCMLDEPLEWGAHTDKRKAIEYVLDHQKMTRVNQAMLDQYGAKEEDFIGISVRELFKHDLDHAREIWTGLFNKGKWHVETREQKLDGTPIIIEGDYICMYDDKGRIIGHFGVQVDVTEQRAIENSLQQTKVEAEAANQAKSEFLANMSHEIRTPMNGILGMSELGLKEKDPEKMRHQLKRVNQSGRLLLGIINDILDFSKIEAGKLELDPQPFRPEQIRDELYSLFQGTAQEKGLEFTALGEPPSVCTQYLYGDPQRLRQILINLIGNAIKFTRSGSVTLKMQQLEASAAEEPGWFEFSVADTGMGISESHQAKLFQAFTQADTSITRQHGGTGLGLVISERLVRLMGGGDIQIQSQPGVGSTFSFRIPLRPCTAEEKADFDNLQAEEGSHRQPLSGRVLLVEDNEINQEVVGAHLHGLGVEFVLANNGQEAVELAQQQAFDLVLMDIQMPVMDGYQATRAIRDFNNSLPIVALTAAAMVEDKNRALQAGMNDHLAKPIDPKQLYRLLVQYLAAASLQTKPEPQSTEKPTLLLVCLDKNELKKKARQASRDYRVKVAANLKQAEALIARGGLDEAWLVVAQEDQPGSLQSLEPGLEAAGIRYQYK